MIFTAPRSLLLVVACLTLLLKSDALVLTVPLELYLNSPALRSTGPLEFNITGRVVSADPITACTSVNNPDELNGNIVIIEDRSCNFEAQARTSQAAGAIGVIIREVGAAFAGINHNAYNYADRSDITIPIVFISAQDGTVLIQLIANSSEVIAIVSSGDSNAWQIYQTSAAPITFVTIHAAIDLFLASFATYKLVWYFKNKKTTISVAQMSLALMIVGTLLGVILRVVVLAGNFGILAISSSFVLGAVFVPVTLLILAALIVSFYWFELTSKVTAISRTWSKKLWIPFLVGCGILVALLVVLMLWPVFFKITSVLVVLFTLYAAIVLTVAIIWIVFGAKLYKALMENTSKVSQRNTARFKRLVALIVLCACFLILMCLIIAMANFVGNDPVTNAAIFETAQFLAEGTTLVIIFLFSTSKKKSNSSDQNSHSLQTRTPRATSMTLTKVDLNSDVANNNE
jgi:hypothetical protein